MTARKKALTPNTASMIKSLQMDAEQTPVTVAELLLALASYPQDAPVDISPYASLTTFIVGDPESEWRAIWEPYPGDGSGQRPRHYRRPDIIERVIRRSEPMDDFAAAREFLEWIAAEGYEPPRQSTGGGHNEPTTYRDLPALELAQKFAEREQS